MSKCKVRGGAAFSVKLNELKGKLDKAKKVRVGFLEGATYPDGTAVAQVAFWNEYGTDTAPPRPFFRDMIKAKSGTWSAGVAVQLKANNMDVGKALNLAGMGIKDQLVDSINEFSTPENAAATVAKKGFNKPLIDTGHMRNSVDYEVTDGD